MREITVELRALRTELTTLSRTLGFTARASPPYHGVLHQPDRLGGDVRLERNREEEVELRARTEATLTRRGEYDRTAGEQIRRAHLARIEQRRRELLLALRRAERALAEAPKQLPTGVRDVIIGEIYRARHAAALYGSPGGSITTGGMINTAG